MERFGVIFGDFQKKIRGCKKSVRNIFEASEEAEQFYKNVYMVQRSFSHWIHGECVPSSQNCGNSLFKSLPEVKKTNSIVEKYGVVD